MEWIGHYKQISEFTNEHAGTAEWCLAKKSGRIYFVKKFQNPVYPSEALGLSPEKYQKRIDRFHAVESRYRRLYDALNAHNSTATMIVPETVATFQFHICTIAEYFEGNINLQDVHNLSPWQRLILMRTLTLAMMNVHMAGVVHGDIKPDNIMIFQDATTGMCQLRLIDFDGSYFITEAPKTVDDINGDMAYWAPEIYAKFEHASIILNERIDNFALGIVLYYMWFGKLPDKPKDQTIGQYIFSGNKIQIDESKMPLAISKTIQGLLTADPQKRMTCEQAYYILGIQMEQYPKDIIILESTPNPDPNPNPNPEPPHPAPTGESYVTVYYNDTRGNTIEEEKYYYAGTKNIVIPAKEIGGYTIEGCKSQIVSFDDDGTPSPTSISFTYKKNYRFALIVVIMIIIALIALAALYSSNNGTNVAQQIKGWFTHSSTKATLMGDSDYGDEYSYPFNGPYQRRQIATISFRDSIDASPETAWDASDRGDGSVLAWATKNNSGFIYEDSALWDIPTDGVYDLVIAGDGGVYAPENCFNLFGDFPALRSIQFNGCFYTSDVTNMSSMFGGGFYLENIDMEGIDTSKVTDMSNMFACNFALNKLDISEFDTRNVTNMQMMFYGNSKLRLIKTGDYFEVSPGTITDEMLEDCPVLQVGAFVYATPTPTPKRTPTPTPKRTPTPTPKRIIATSTPKSSSNSNKSVYFSEERFRSYSSILTLQDKGDEVRKLQEALITLGYLNDTADGIYGKLTRQAVYDFQKNNGFSSPSGIASPLTQYVLYSNDARAVWDSPVKVDRERGQCLDITNLSYVYVTTGGELESVIVAGGVKNTSSTAGVLACTICYFPTTERNKDVYYHRLDTFDSWGDEVLSPHEKQEDGFYVANSTNFAVVDGISVYIAEIYFSDGQVYHNFDDSGYALNYTGRDFFDSFEYWKLNEGSPADLGL